METCIIKDDQILFSVDNITTKPASYAGSDEHWHTVPYVKSDFSGLLIPKRQIDMQLIRLAYELHKDFQGKNPHMMWVADGAYPFFRDFKKIYDSVNGEQYTTAMARIKSYAGTESTGNIRVLDADFSEVKGRNVLLFEDIVDTGNSMHQILPQIKKHNPLDVTIVTLLDKRVEKTYDVAVGYTLFSIPNKFVVGYGLDYRNMCRDLDDIYVLDVPTGKPRLDMLVDKTS